MDGCVRWSATTALVLLFAASCGGTVSEGDDAKQNDERRYTHMRKKMVKTQLERRGIGSQRVLTAIEEVPRHLFVPPDLSERAYDDGALPIGEGQTISQPYIVAIMTELLNLKQRDRVLEVGTGSGYQAAVLALLVDSVFTVEILEPLVNRAARTLRDLGYSNVNVRLGDGYRGWPEKAPFDAIMVTAAPDHVPQLLVNQLRDGGRMVIPVGRHEQELVLLVKEGAEVRQDRIIPVRFVPMTGEAQEK